MDFSFLRKQFDWQDATMNLDQMRKRLLNILLYNAAIIGTGFYLASMGPAISSRLYPVIVVYTVSYVWLLVITFAKRLPYRLRTNSWLFFLYSFGVFNLLLSGFNVGSGLFLLTYIAMCTLLYSLQAGIRAIAVSLASIGVMAFVIVSGGFDLRLRLPQEEALLWVIGGTVFLLMGIILVVSLTVLLGGLALNLARATGLAEELRQKNEALVESEARYRNLVETSPDAILLVGLDGKILMANAGSDGGDLITAAFTGGIAHPTGYPLYLLLARLFQSLPLGSLAYRTNLMSAVLMALAAALAYRLAARSPGSGEGEPAWPAGLAAGYAFGLAPLVWSQALITEVYALQAFLTLIILSLYAQPEPLTTAGGARLDCQRGLALGLGVSNHLTALLLLPAALLLGSFRARSGAEGIPQSEKRWPGGFVFHRGSLLRQLAWLGLGASLYLLLPLRALGHPPLNWGNPLTPARAWWLVSGSLYQDYYLQFNLGGIWEGLRSWAGLQLEQFGVPGLVLGLIGLVYFWRPSRLYILTAWSAAVSLIFAIVYNSADSYLYLIPAFTCFAVWIGLGVGGLLGQPSQRYARFGLVAGLLLAGYFAGRSLAYLGQVDASHDRRAETFIADVLAAAPKDAILFAQGDRALFALWYAHFALGVRPDLAVIAPDLLHFDWYQETLKSTYPALSLPGPLPWPGTVAAANPDRPACYVQYTEQTEIECLQTTTTPQ